MTFRAFAVTVFQQKGWRGFYTGAFPALIQIVPYMGLNFAIYDWLAHRARGTTSHNSSSSSVVSSAYAGSISGAISKVVVYPLDTVKRRLQAQALLTEAERTTTLYNYRYRGMYDCLVTIYRQEGWTSFYRGMVPSVLKTTIATSLSFALYRWTRNVLESIHNNNDNDRRRLRT
jgi:solute carrier family 25 (mitochondrial thiamine pyrophosphate transporter), member 19